MGRGFTLALVIFAGCGGQTAGDVAPVDAAPEDVAVRPPDSVLESTPDLVTVTRDLAAAPDLAGCLADGDCKTMGAAHCDPVTHRCVGCVIDDHCGAGSICVDGSCITGCNGNRGCSGGLTCCAMRCVDTSMDAAHCGGCGVVCGGKACCAGACADTLSDTRHCGGCGMACAAAPNAMVACAAGKCTPGMCSPGFADCNGMAGDGCEVAVSSDGRNCGQCGRSCAAPNAMTGCVAGNCLIASCDTGFRDCNGLPADGCETDVASDVKNCGACGSNCQALPHASAGCGNGACVVSLCDAGYGNCDKMDANGCEADLSSDAAHCGGCGKPCPAPPNVVTGCMNSMCQVGGCVMGYSDCNNNMGDGCEARLATDPRNCGMCGVVCPAPSSATAGCAGGVCGVGMCNAGFGDCDKNAGNGCEVNLDNNASHCGGCGKACQQGQSCNKGRCQSVNECAFADEGFIATLTCPLNTRVASIDFASYGTPAGNCGGYQVSNCHAANSEMIVQGLCLGQNSCSVPSDNNTFGDPCFGIYKHLYIQASCQ